VSVNDRALRALRWILPRPRQRQRLLLPPAGALVAAKKSTPNERPTGGARPKATVREEAPIAYQAYAVGVDGSRTQIDARSIVVNTGTAEIEIDLEVSRPLLVGQLCVSTDGLLIVGHADASAMHLRVVPWETDEER
jgi:hypothetical protein